MRNKQGFVIGCLILFLGSFLPAQDISWDFPDENFRQAVWEWLGYTGEAGSFTAGDIQAKLGGNEDALEVESRNIGELTGIGYFQGLEILKCSDNRLTGLPSLPESLRWLYCDGNRLTSLPELPRGLTYLYCQTNQLGEIPGLPPELVRLDGSANQLADLPELPAGLAHLSCTGNQLTGLPELPESLAWLDCADNQIPDLPELPESLTWLYCQDNQLASLPELGQALERLFCQNNQLTSLPALPESLIQLNCSTNELIDLPELPEDFTWLFCTENRLSSLPELPENITHFNCSMNRLTDLPALPPGLTWFDCSANRLTSLPELPVGLSWLICTENRLTSLPELPPDLRYLYSQDNLLTNLPDLPENLTYLYCNDNRLTGLPALPPGLIRLDCRNNDLTGLPELPASLRFLLCAGNFINLYTGVIHDMIVRLDPAIAVLSPQYRWYSGESLLLESGTTFALPAAVVQKHQTTDGIGWSFISGVTAWEDFLLASTDESVASVLPDGTVAALGAGTCAIEARYRGINAEYTYVILPVLVEGSDTNPPELQIPADITAEATALLTPVEIGQATATDESDVIITNDAPAVFPLGTTSVTWTAVDAYGNRTTGIQAIMVVDTTAPVLTVPADITTEATGSTTPVEIGQATATDIFPVTITNNAPAAFPPGTTSVTWTAVDANGNRATAAQAITITPGRRVTIRFINSEGGGIAGGLVFGGICRKRFLGVTDENGELVKELEPRRQKFWLVYKGACQLKRQDTSINPVVVFQTHKTEFRLLDQAGNGLEGGKIFHRLHQLGETDSTGTLRVELLPQTYHFRLYYLRHTRVIRQNIAANPLVIFQITGHGHPCWGEREKKRRSCKKIRVHDKGCHNGRNRK